jgi:histidinol-phosphate/aromatic aminotransferase/cobyric acid decarboxylase-like protein/adenosyl cobinamide kinase/adenosyl cobinamide phosphate guanylyltransferase
MSLTLVTGGTRSGKSAHAERLALASGLPVRYVATADGDDPSLADRIGAHRARRPPEWTTVQAGAELADALAGADGACVLVDGLGPWIARALDEAGAFAEGGALRVAEADVLARIERAVRAAARPGVTAIVVAEQAGSGLLPPDAASRAWLDLLGAATQRFAAGAGHVELVVAGRALTLGGAPPAADAALRQHGDRDVRPGDADHAVNVVAGGPPGWLRTTLRAALAQDVARYPDERPATAALAARHGREPDEIVPTNGAAEALWLLPAALRPRHAVCVHPAFTEAEAALHAYGVRTTRVQRDPEHNFALDPTAVPADADLVVVGNPASPSGTLDPAAALLALRRQGRVVVVDEAFMDLVVGEPASLVRDRLDDVVVVRSLTKALAVPGLRVGYAVAPPALAERLRTVRPPWSCNALALAALEAAAQRPDAIADIAARAAAERADLAGRLASIAGVRVWPGAANFCLVEVADGPAVVAALRARDIAVRPAASFPGLGPGHLRLTARAPAANARLVEAIEEVVAACV